MIQLWHSLEIYPKDSNVAYPRDTYTSIFIEALFTKAKVYNLPMSQTTKEYIKKIECIWIYTRFCQGYKIVTCSEMVLSISDYMKWIVILRKTNRFSLIWSAEMLYT